MTKQKHILLLIVLCTWRGISANQAAIAPQIRLPGTLEHKALYAGGSTNFTVNATGDAPLSFQWRLDGQDLTAQTNRMIKITNAQAADEGDYTILVSSPYGEATSRPAHLFVVPTPEFLVHNYTNEFGKRLPYLYIVPQNYDPSLRYSLFVGMSGGGVNEDNYRDIFGPTGMVGAAADVLTSYRERVRHPVIILSPLRRSGDQAYGPADMPLVAGMINHLITQYNIDTNQIHLMGYSDGASASVTLLERYPNLFASAFLVSGGGTTNPSLFKHVPLWAFTAADESMRSLVSMLRQAGSAPIYSEFASGGHLGPISIVLVTPFLLDWLLDQRLGTTPKEPILLIDTPTEESFYTTGAASLSVAGSLEAPGLVISGVSWENTTTKTKGLASGTNNWNAEISLMADKTNTVIITATATNSWVPAFGGTTTLSDTLSVLSTPVQTSLTVTAPGAALNWTGGVAPFRVQSTGALPAVNWIDLSTDAVPPLTLNLDQAARFYRVIGH